MTYIDLINQFWELDEYWQFTCCETRLYFYLLKTANRLGWVDSLMRGDDRLACEVGISPNSLKTARNRLSQADLLSFTPGGKGKGNKTRYQLRYQKVIPKVEPKVIPKVDPNLIPKVEPKPINNVRALDEDKDEDNSFSIAGDIPGFPLSNIFDKPLGECYDELSKNQQWAEVVTMNIRSSGHKDFTLDKFQEYLIAFFRKQQNKGEETMSPKDAMSYFGNWIDTELAKNKNNGKDNRKPDKAAKARMLLDEYVAIEQGNNAGIGKTEIPDL